MGLSFSGGGRFSENGCLEKTFKKGDEIWTSQKGPKFDSTKWVNDARVKTCMVKPNSFWFNLCPPY